MMWYLYGLIGYGVIGLITLLLHKPEDTADAVMLMLPCFLMWPLLLLGWIISRPFA